jgi:6,7-dimethyl-8-ribityllumazine synthase
MKEAKSNQQTDKTNALRALRIAIVVGATWRYEQLVALAVKAGVTDDEIDEAARHALQALLGAAELPLTTRELALVGRHGMQFRR